MSAGNELSNGQANDLRKIKLVDIEHLASETENYSNFLHEN